MWLWSPRSPPYRLPCPRPGPCCAARRWCPDWPSGRCCGSTQEVSPDAVRAYGDGGHADAEAATAAYVAAAEAVADGFTAKAARASGAATEVLTASAGLARDKGLRQAVAHPGRGRHAPARGGARGGRAVRRRVHRDGRADGRAGHRPARHRAPGRGPPGRASRSPASRVPEVASVLVAADLAPADTAGLDPAFVLALVTQKGGATSHTAIIARQLGIPCVVGVAGALDLAGRRRGPGRRAPPGTIDPSVDADEARARVEADRSTRAALDSWTGPAETTDGVHVRLLANVADGESARQAAEAPVEGVGPVPHRAVLPRPPRRAHRSRSRPRSTVRCSTPSTARTATSWSAPWTPAPTSRSPSPPSRTRRTRPSASAVSGWPDQNPGLLVRQLDGIAAAAAASGTETWVMAPMVATVGRGERLRRPGPRPGPQGGRDGRGAERGAARGPDARGGRLLVDRHQRPDAVRDGRRPARRRPGSSDRPLAARGAPADRDHRGRRPARGQVGRRLRRGRRRPAAGGRDGRHGRSPRCRWPEPPCAPSARSCLRSVSRHVHARPPRPRWPPPTRWPAATPCGLSSLGDRPGWAARGILPKPATARSSP